MKLLTILIILLWITAGHAVDRKGNGGDTPLVSSGTSWFYGKNKTIDSCIISSGDDVFYQSRETILIAFSKWKAYFKKLSNNIKNIPESMTVSNRCLGNEDLVFYFGVIDKRVKAKIVKYNQPIGFAEIETYNLNNKWGRGIIWISPYASYSKSRQPTLDWTPNRLQAILLHELGHVFGKEHISQTIMTSKISRLIETGASLSLSRYANGVSNKLTSYYMTNINHHRQVDVCLACGSEQIKGILSTTGGEKLLGKKIMTDAKLERKETSFSILINDRNNVVKFPIKIHNASELTSGDQLIQFGHIVGKDGKRHPIRLIFNSPNESAGNNFRITTHIKIDILGYNKKYDLTKYRNLFYSIKDI